MNKRIPLQKQSNIRPILWFVSTHSHSSEGEYPPILTASVNQALGKPFLISRF